MYDPLIEDDEYEGRKRGESSDCDWFTEASESVDDNEVGDEQRRKVKIWRSLGGRTTLVPPNSLKEVGDYETESEEGRVREKSFWTDPRDKEISFKIPSSRDGHPDRGPDLGSSGVRGNKMEQIAYWIWSASPSRVPEEYRRKSKEESVLHSAVEERGEARGARRRVYGATTAEEKEREKEN